MTEQSRPVAIVTGAARGIGLEIARELVRDHRVIGIARRDAPELEALGAELWRTDLTDYAAVGALLAGEPSIDLLVHNAAIAPRYSVAEATPEQWREVLEIDTVAPAVITSLALPALRAAAGTVVFIGSGASRNPVAGSAVYAAAKHALLGIANTLRVEEHPNGIRVTTVAPGPTDTPMARKGDGAGYDPSTRIDPRSVARAVRLAADATDDAHIPDIIVRPRAETPR